MHIIGSEAPNGFWYGDINEVIWGTLAFTVLAIAFIKWGWPALRSVMHDHAESIENQLNAADKAKADAEAELAEFKSSLGDTEGERARIVDGAHDTARALKSDLAARADNDAAALRARTDAEIVGAREQAAADLEAEVRSLTLGAAERVIERNLDAGTQTELVDKYIEQVGAQN